MAELNKEKSKNEGGILKELYSILKPCFSWRNQNDYFEFLGFSCENVGAVLYDSHIRADVIVRDCIDRVRDIIERDKSYNNRLYNNIKERVKCFFDNKEHLSQINKKLIEIVSSNEYIKKIYEGNLIEKLNSYYKLKENVFDLAYNIYLLVYLAFYKELPGSFWAGINYETSLKEFTDEVIEKYGATSKPATRAILALAAKNNIFALYEKADLYYYGSRGNVAQDLSKAYYTYMEAANLKEATQRVADKSFCHPLALWSLSYILFNYHRNGTELEKCPKIKEIEGLEPLVRIERAIMYAQMANDFFSKSEKAESAESIHGPSLNILGQIALLSEDEFSGIEKLRKSYNMKAPEYYFKLSADQGYIYAQNNLALMESEKIFSESPTAQQEHLRKYIDMLKEQAEKCEPWACNTLGEFYRTGVVKRRNGIIGATTVETQLFRREINQQLAYKYYKLAVENFKDVNSAWAYCNMLIYYQEEIKKEKLLESYVKAVQTIGKQEHIDLLKRELNNLYGRSYEEIIGGDAHES